MRFGCKQHGARIAADCRLRAARRLQLGRARRARRLDRLGLSPRYDSGSVFGRILDRDAGHWSIRLAAAFTSERRCLPGTLVIETTFATDTGTVKVADALVLGDGPRGRDLGYDSPQIDKSRGLA